MAEVQKNEEEKSQFYWFAKHIKESINGFYLRHRVKFFMTIFVLGLLVFFLRAPLHSYVMAARTRIFLLVLGAPALWCIMKLLLSGPWLRRVLTAALVAVLGTGLLRWGDELHEYMAFYYRYRMLTVHELQKLPISGHERIQPLNSIHSLASEVMGDMETPTTPYFVRDGKEYRWTMGIEPSYFWRRTFAKVEKVFNVPGTTAAPNFGMVKPVQVSFPVGKTLYFGSNSRVAAIKSFGPWKYLNYEPDDVIYIPDGNGKVVQVITLIRWKGIFFPRPEFGGVQLVRDGHMSLLKLLLFGAGEWIAPERIQDHPFLKGQNILSYRVSRYVANSFRFQEGFFAPFPGNHKGDIRIPDLPDDVNDEPFTVHFEKVDGNSGMLFHYFALEPFAHDKQGLNTSLFIRADGSGVTDREGMQVYAYRHHARGEMLAGVSTISTKVMESKKMYDWNKFRPVEHRPYTKEIGGEVRFFWLTTVIALKETSHEGGGKQFIAGSKPEVVLTDATRYTTSWVDPREPDKWLDVVLERQKD